MNIAQTVCQALHGDMLVGGNACLVPGPGHGKDDRSLSVKNDSSNPEGFVVNSFAEDDPVACRDYVREAAGLPAWQAARTERPADPQFVYRDQHGEPYLRVTKVHKPGGKSFYQHSWNGHEWKSGGQQVRIPYRLPEVIAADTIYIVEGEKDADRLAGLGLVATTCPMGAGKWRDELNQWFAGKTVTILADNDEPGRKHAEQVEVALKGVAKTVRAFHFPMLPEGGDVSDWLDTGKSKADLLAYVAGAGEPTRERFSLDWFHDIEDSMPKETFIKGVFGVNEFTMLSGKPGSGKSVITTDAACHVAAGKEWHGRKVKQGLVVYIAAERKDLTKRRMLAFRKRHHVGNIPLLVMGGRMDLTTGLKDAEDIAATIKRAEEDCGMSCVWIIVDTLTRTFGPGDQNQSKDMTRFIQSCDTIREAVTGSHVTVIHHTGWAGDRGKGAIDLDGAVDASFLVKKEASGYVLECDGANDGDEGVICHFRMEGVQVGTDEDGEPTMAPVVIPTEGKTAGEHLVASLKKHEAHALDLLRQCCHEDGRSTDEAWREAFYAAGGSEKRDTLLKRFTRAKATLIASGHVNQLDRWVWPDGQTDKTDGHGQMTDNPETSAEHHRRTDTDTPFRVSVCPAACPAEEGEKEEKPNLTISAQNSYQAARDGNIPAGNVGTHGMVDNDDHPSPHGLPDDDFDPPAFLRRAS